MIRHNLKSWKTLTGENFNAAPLADARALLTKHCFTIAQETEDIPQIIALADRLKAYRDILVFGTGGSSLGAQTLCTLQESPKPRLHFLDNIDPHTFDHYFKALDLKTTAFIVVSKSGSTAETLSQFLHLLSLLRAGALLPQAIVVITEPGERPMRTLAEQHNLMILDHPPLIGGRFSILSNVGLLPAACAGIDIAQVRAGARAVLDNTKNVPLGTSMAEKGALMVHALSTERNTVVMMPYCDRLVTFAKWFGQLWGESLGKNGLGTTPVVAVGTVDQHSQLQLYLDGPKDKIFTLFLHNTRHKGVSMEDNLVDLIPSLAYLKNKTMGDLFAAEQYATVDTLQNHNCPTRVLEFDALNPHTLGSLAMHFMIETVCMATLMGVDPFNQPAVEESKVLTRRYMTQFEAQTP